MKQKLALFAAFKTRCVQVYSGYKCSKTNLVTVDQPRPVEKAVENTVLKGKEPCIDGCYSNIQYYWP